MMPLPVPRLSCLPVSLYAALGDGSLDLAGWFALAREAGLDGADLSVLHLARASAADLDAIARAARDAGVAVPMLVSYPDFTHPDARVRAAQRDDLRRWIEVAWRLGVGAIRITAGQAHPETREADGLRWAAHGLTGCLDEARAAGVALLFENHVRGTPWRHHDFSQPAARFLALLDATAGSSLGVLFDTANPLVLRDDPQELLDRALPRVVAVHLSDIRRAGSFEPVLLGDGVAPLADLLVQLRAGGFAGWFSIEEASRGGADGVRRAAERARRLLAP
ncbi:MAG: sugar phosphate isomerase/epimerase [Chloroflexi bacterium]|nr:sugar phosphate isomerase/epimerase [Chloroflexota bacterium]